MAEHNELGKKGEEYAKIYLIQNGYEILASNWRYGNNEIDIIAQKNKEMAIIEVKTRSSFFGSDATTTVTKTKQKFLIKAAHAYLTQKNIDFDTRFDIITVIISNNKHTIEHIEDAFYPTL